jgi:hypothetical protein
MSLLKTNKNKPEDMSQVSISSPSKKSRRNMSNSKPEKVNRRDIFGTKIKKGSKKHKITFAD